MSFVSGLSSPITQAEVETAKGPIIILSEPQGESIGNDNGRQGSIPRLLTAGGSWWPPSIAASASVPCAARLQSSAGRRYVPRCAVFQQASQQRSVALHPSLRLHQLHRRTAAVPGRGPSSLVHLSPVARSAAAQTPEAGAECSRGSRGNPYSVRQALRWAVTWRTRDCPYLVASTNQAFPTQLVASSGNQFQNPAHDEGIEIFFPLRSQDSRRGKRDIHPASRALTIYQLSGWLSACVPCLPACGICGSSATAAASRECAEWECIGRKVGLLVPVTPECTSDWTRLDGGRGLALSAMHAGHWRRNGATSM
ncbi:hypothetical protein GQ607_000444 [Colletotrichum asianum]|uniref:Uncharacterized protein n=1 Tax=Colletotrichum asianum TaxID=702518 RepID=A0A8H3WQM2_9PEZI|nr:hypothetical protein GQ607_000444 [Colletotrichum asianum]